MSLSFSKAVLSHLAYGLPTWASFPQVPRLSLAKPSGLWHIWPCGIVPSHSGIRPGCHSSRSSFMHSLGFSVPFIFSLPMLVSTFFAPSHRVSIRCVRPAPSRACARGDQEGKGKVESSPRPERLSLTYGERVSPGGLGRWKVIRFRLPNSSKSQCRVPYIKSLNRYCDLAVEWE